MKKASELGIIFEWFDSAGGSKIREEKIVHSKEDFRLIGPDYKTDFLI